MSYGLAAIPWSEVNPRPISRAKVRAWAYRREVYERSQIQAKGIVAGELIAGTSEVNRASEESAKNTAKKSTGVHALAGQPPVYTGKTWTEAQRGEAIKQIQFAQLDLSRVVEA